jgi:hypothetical protein
MVAFDGEHEPPIRHHEERALVAVERRPCARALERVTQRQRLVRPARPSPERVGAGKEADEVRRMCAHEHRGRPILVLEDIEGIIGQGTERPLAADLLDSNADVAAGLRRGPLPFDDRVEEVGGSPGGSDPVHPAGDRPGQGQRPVLETIWRKVRLHQLVVVHGDVAQLTRLEHRHDEFAVCLDDLPRDNNCGCRIRDAHRIG